MMIVFQDGCTDVFVDLFAGAFLACLAFDAASAADIIGGNDGRELRGEGIRVSQEWRFSKRLLYKEHVGQSRESHASLIYFGSTTRHRKMNALVLALASRNR
jgi:hypothetical protein